MPLCYKNKMKQDEQSCYSSFLRAKEQKYVFLWKPTANRAQWDKQRDRSHSVALTADIFVYFIRAAPSESAVCKATALFCSSNNNVYLRHGAQVFTLCTKPLSAFEGSQ